ncbi:MAG: isoprenylcysteine carboxylmethyltransferase family protein [Solirubrobacteraceae bacterium]|nr:isoprenylcysteine carboxylmethyltransferase family protein [Solirubrobacteraceae bacterium]
MKSRAGMGSALFFLVGPGVEAGLAPWLLTGGFIDAGSPAPLRVLGALLCLAGIAVLATTFASFAGEGAGTPSPAAPTGRLVVAGAYRHVRNPMYLASAAIIVGEGLLLGQWILLAGAAAYLAAMAGLAARVEEPRLRRRFGADYREYRDAVPGWLPSRRAWRPEG